jgi:hypothetical protein
MNKYAKFITEKGLFCDILIDMIENLYQTERIIMKKRVFELN